MSPGELDALTFWVNGFQNVTFIYGTQGFTDELFEALLRRHTKRMKLAYDADDSGHQAAARDAERLMAQGIECFRVKFPWGMDANEYAQKVQPAPKSLQTMLNSAEWVGKKSPKPQVQSPTSEKEPSHTHAGAPVLSSSLAANLAAKEKEQPASKPSAQDEPRLEQAGEYHVLKLGPREYRVGGLEKNNSLEVMKVSLRLRHGDLFHLDGFDLLRDGERRRFIERAAEETRLEKELIKRDLGKLLLLLEEEQQARLTASLKPETGNRKPEMSEEKRKEALAFLKLPNLIDRLVETFPACGLAGESKNLLASYLACTSRKLDRPLAIIIQSTSAAVGDDQEPGQSARQGTSRRTVAHPF